VGCGAAARRDPATGKQLYHRKSLRGPRNQRAVADVTPEAQTTSTNETANGEHQLLYSDRTAIVILCILALHGH